MFTDEESRYIKWYDYLWLAIPIAGIALMVAMVVSRKIEEEYIQKVH